MTNEVTSIGVGMDTDGVERGIKTLKVLAEQGPKVEKAMSGIEGAAKSTGRTLESLAKGAPDLKGVADGAQKAGSALRGMGQQAREAVTGTESLRRAMGQLSAEEQKYIKGLYDEARQLSMTRGEKAAYIAQSKGMSASAQEVARAIGNKVDALKQEQSALGMLRTGYGAAATAIQGFMALQVVSWSKQSASALYEASAAAERLKIGLDFASARGSAQEIAYLRSTTHSLGLAFQSTAQSYMQFQAAAKGTTLEGEKARAVFESVAKASAVMGLSAEQNSGVLLALQQMVSKGTVQAEELRGQLGERLPGAFQIAARAMGVTTAELGKMLEQGRVVSEDFLPKFAKELEASLGGAAEKAADRLDAAVNRFDNAWERLKQNVGDSGVSRMMADSLGSAAGSLDAISLAMESARLKGDGFWGQMGAAIGVMDDLASGSDRLTVNMYDNAKATAEAQKELDRLQRLAATQGTSAWLLKEIANVQRYIGQLQQARREKEALLGGTIGASDPREKYSSPGADYANWLNQQEKARQGLLEISAKSNGVTKQFTGDLKAYEEALRTGVISTNDYVKAVTELNKKRYESTEAGKAEAKAAKDAAKGNKEGESAILSYIKSLEARTAAQRLEIAQGDKLTESQRARIQLEALLADSKNKATAGQIAYAKAQLAESEANEAWLKNASDVEKALADMQKAREQSLQSVQDSVKKLVEEAEAAAYAETHNISLAEAVERLALARAENAYQQAVERQQSPETLAYLEAELQARKKIVELTAQKGVREANQKAQDQIAKDWERVSQTIGDTLADYIMGGGKDAAQYLKRLFATLVLQPVVQTVVGSVMGTGSAAVAGGAANPLGLLQSGQSLWSSFSGGLSGTLATGVTQLGSLMGSSFLGELGAGIAAGGQLGIGGTASLIGSAGGTTGVGMTIGAAAPWIAGAAALYSLVKSFDNSGTPHMGAGAIYSDGKVSGGRGIYNRGTFGMGAAGEWSSSNQSAISGIAGTLGGALDGFAKAFGKEAGYTVATAFADDSSGDGAWGSLRIADALGNVLVDWERSRSSKWAPRIFADGEAGYQQYLSAVAGDVKKAFLAMDLPGWADEVLSAAKDINTLGAAIQQIGNIKTVFDSLGKSMEMFSDLSGAVQTKLLQVSGGIETLATNAQSFYANYYSEQEKLDAVVGGLTTTLAKYGVQLPTTAEAYRALVEKQMAAGESAAELAAVLLSLNGTFKQVADAWKQELQGMGDAVAGIFDGLYTSIGQLKDATAADRASILRGDQAMSADAIAAAIQAASIAAPSVSGLTSAAAGIAAAKGAYAHTDAAYKGALSVSGAKKQALDETTSRRDALQQQLDGATASHNATFANFTRIWEGRLGSYEGRLRHRAEWAVMEVQYASLSKQLSQEIEALNAVIADQTGVYNEAASATELYAKKLEEAKKAIESAQQAELQAKVEYASEMAQFIQDAGTSVTKLGDLRSEIVDFYQAQAEAVQSMLQSAGNLRSVVDQLRLGQLDSAQTAAELSSRYAANYSMALATSGSTRAGYVDAMAGSLPALTDALKAQAATGEDWRIQTAKLFAQATTAAGLLEGDAKTSDYQEVALGLLDSIDGALSALGGAAQSAQDLIVSAIEQGTASNLVGLRAVIAALKGDPIPAFAAGGLHAGGLRIVGEHGPELEATGPARIWNASQTAAMLGGGSINMQRVERLMEQRNEEARAQASAIVRLQQDVNRLLMRWETQGMPEQREVSAT